MDPMVGNQCGEGLALVGTHCVPIGVCVSADGGPAVGFDASGLDAEPGGATLDAAEPDAAPEGVDGQQALDGHAIDDGAPVLDADGDGGAALSPLDGSGTNDTAGKQDAPAPDTKKADTAQTPDAKLDAPADAPLPGLDAGTPDTRDAARDSIVDTRDVGSLGDIPILFDLPTDLGRDGGDAVGACVGCQDAADASVQDARNDGPDAPATTDVPTDGIDPGEAGLTCTAPTVVCNDQCADLSTDEWNCGKCGKNCGFLICIDGTCQNCASGEKACNGECVDPQSDPANCGTCGTVCDSGACRFGACKATTAGHAFVIGHDFRNASPDINTLLGNAVFAFTSATPLQIAYYSTSANSSALRNANNAISAQATALGRTYTRTAVTTGSITTVLAAADVFLIHGLENATDATLTQLATDWATALALFVHTGGILVILDGDYAGNAGTVSVLSQAGILDIQRATSASNAQCELAAPSDTVASGVATPYTCPANSTTFATTDGTKIVESGGAPVVVHKAF
jgi:hypothetical protein